jgi:hypothetical protein
MRAASPWRPADKKERKTRMRAPAVVVGSAVILIATMVGAAVYEAPADRSAKDIVAAGLLKGPHHRVRDLVPADGYTDRWTVDSDFGVFEAVGDGALRKLVPEISAIAELRKLSKTEAFAKGLGSATKAPLNFARSLITHPVDTVTGVPRGAYELVENAGTSISTTRNPAEDSRAAQVLKMSSYKRDLADKLNVDVYSSNKVLQKQLNGLAWAASLGDIAFSVAMLPAGVGGTVVSNVRLANSVKNIVKDEPPQRLRIRNEETLKTIGVAEDLRTRFLDHPVFTPRQFTIICLNLEALKDVGGRDAFVSVALGAQDEVQATFYTTMAQLLRGYHQTVSPLTTITPLGRLAIAQTRTGPAVLALPLDRLIWTERVDQVSGHFANGYAGPGFNGKVDLWLTGTVSRRARQELSGRGFGVTENAHLRVEVLD